MSAWNTRAGRTLLVASAAAVIAATPLGAQDSPAPPEEPCSCVGELRVGAGPWRMLAASRRARLGVVLGETMQVAGRSGVELEDVAEGSPAQRAGLRQGDIILALDGRDLGPEPRAGLVDAMGNVEPGDTVEVTFSRGAAEQTARVVTDAGRTFRRFEDPEGVHFRTLAPDPSVMRRARVLRRMELEPSVFLRSLERQGLREGLKLAGLNPGLGEYFGTERGVLVTEADADSPLGLESGDVILSIGGREVQDPAHVRSILASYREGEEIAFRIVREKRTREITGRRS